MQTVISDETMPVVTMADMMATASTARSPFAPALYPPGETIYPYILATKDGAVTTATAPGHREHNQDALSVEVVESFGLSDREVGQVLSDTVCSLALEVQALSPGSTLVVVIVRPDAMGGYYSQCW